MAMNRQTKRMLQKQGQLNEEGQPVRQARPRPDTTVKTERTGPRQFVKEVRGELRKVAWPSRTEVANYAVVVLLAIVLLTALVAVLDYALGEAVLQLFER